MTDTERLRLTGTSRTRQDMGRVEIQLADKWYSVCIDDNVATTVCQLLNLPRWVVDCYPYWWARLLMLTKTIEEIIWQTQTLKIKSLKQETTCFRCIFRKEAVPLWESPGTKEPERLLIRFYCRGWYSSLLGCQQMLIRGYCSSDSNFYGVYCSNCKTSYYSFLLLIFFIVVLLVYKNSSKK